jgi:hypothetical protein
MRRGWKSYAGTSNTFGDPVADAASLSYRAAASNNGGRHPAVNSATLMRETCQ